MTGSRLLRARQSCDACKNRKTKCVRTGTGPCQYCASSGGPCSTSVRQQRRPYYRVSEEEYQCCIRLLGHFVPNATLDLKTMKAMIAELEQGGEISDIASTSAEPAVETEESEVLNEELGCMVINSRGGYSESLRSFPRYPSRPSVVPAFLVLMMTSIRWRRLVGALRPRCGTVVDIFPSASRQRSHHHETPHPIQTAT